MADTDVWGLGGPIASPAAGDRAGWATGPLAGGYSLRGSFVWKNAAGLFNADGDILIPTSKSYLCVNENYGIGGRSGDGLEMHAANGDSLQFGHRDGATFVKRMSLLGTGNLGIGTGGGAAVRLHVKSNAEISRLEGTTARGSGNNFVTFYDPTGRKGYFGYAGIFDDFYIINEMNRELIFATNATSRWQITRSGTIEPMADNAYGIGHPSFRASEIRLVNPPIVTSDEREKTWRGAMSPAEISAAKRIAAELGFYQWNDSIAEKGAVVARLHFGVRAQSVWAIMADEGLIPALAEGIDPDSKYAFLCWDKWDAIAPVEAEEEELDGEGNVIVAAQSGHPGREAGNRFGIRPDQLALFLSAAQEARLAALEAT